MAALWHLSPVRTFGLEPTFADPLRAGAYSITLSAR
jgi:hypothetical protein